MPPHFRSGPRLIAALVVLVTTAVVHAAPADAAVATAPVRVMPLGDSITEGFDGRATYRYWLGQRLRSAGHRVDFVGSRHGVRNGTPRYADFDQDHEGHVGWRADQLVDGKWNRREEGRLAEWVGAHRPDVVLLHAGTNDIRQCQSPSSTAGDISRIIATARAANPDVDVLLARIIPTTPDTRRWCASRMSARLRELNDRIDDLARDTSTPRSTVTVVDHHADFSLPGDTFDGVHPDESGERTMAERWFAALDPLLASAS